MSETPEVFSDAEEEDKLRTEVREQIEAELSQNQGQLDTLRHLENQAGWKIVKALIDGQASRREQLVLGEPLQNAHDAYKKEFMKGEARGLRLIPILVQSMIEEAEAMADALNREVEQQEKEKEPHDGLY